ncbi:MAG: hypothetical protein FWB91_04690, partial [Defluviitaleaceae bacterium]|nr:hypothetical protein [Defluviitaleaceae bacterium]
MMTRVAESFRNIDGPRIKRFCANNAAFLAFVVLVIVAIILRGDVFLSSTNILNILRHNAIIGIIALGMTVVIILGDISLSVGSQLALVGWIAIDIFNRTNNVFLAILACALASIVAGLFEGVLTAKFKIPSIIVTLGTMTIYRSIVLFALSGGGLMAGVPPGGAGADRDRAAAAVYQS